MLTPDQYIHNRQAYAYSDPDADFTIIQTGNLPYAGPVRGIFPRAVPATHPLGINLRKFEKICQSVFRDGCAADEANALTPNHMANIKTVALAIVHWKMASQGGRADLKVNNVASKWQATTCAQLLRAHGESSLSKFRIGGVRIPTASAFLRFLRPEQFGIIDRRVVGNHTQPAGITTLNLRPADGYINDVAENVRKFAKEYTPLLFAEAAALNALGATFEDVDEHGDSIASAFRPCDVEMALF